LLVDTHAHLFLEDFDADRDTIIKQAHEVGVTTIINAGIDVSSSKEAIHLATIHPGLHAAVGIHPQSAPFADSKDFQEISILAKDDSVVAIGEIGLDYYRGTSSRLCQLQIFEQMLALASEKQLPVILHSRSAETDMLEILQKWSAQSPPVRGKWRGVRHCFGESLEIATSYIDMGFMLSFGAYIGYPSSKNLHSVLGNIPAESFLLETDSPYLPPQSLRGKRNLPEYTKIVAEEIARIRKVSVDEIAWQTTVNARLLFEL